MMIDLERCNVDVVENQKTGMVRIARRELHQVITDELGSEGDIVFLCITDGDVTTVTYPREIISVIFPLLGDIIPRTSECCQMFLRKEAAQIFITLDGVEAETLKMIVKSVIEGKSSRLTNQHFDEIYKMLGLGYIEKFKNTSKVVEHVEGDPNKPTIDESCNELLLMDIGENEKVTNLSFGETSPGPDLKNLEKSIENVDEKSDEDNSDDEIIFKHNNTLSNLQDSEYDTEEEELQPNVDTQLTKENDCNISIDYDETDNEENADMIDNLNKFDFDIDQQICSHNIDNEGKVDDGYFYDDIEGNVDNVGEENAHTTANYLMECGPENQADSVDSEQYGQTGTLQFTPIKENKEVDNNETELGSENYVGEESENEGRNEELEPDTETGDLGLEPKNGTEEEFESENMAGEEEFEPEHVAGEEELEPEYEARERELEDRTVEGELPSENEARTVGYELETETGEVNYESEYNKEDKEKEVEFEPVNDYDEEFEPENVVEEEFEPENEAREQELEDRTVEGGLPSENEARTVGSELETETGEVNYESEYNKEDDEKEVEFEPVNEYDESESEPATQYTEMVLTNETDQTGDEEVEPEGNIESDPEYEADSVVSEMGVKAGDIESVSGNVVFDQNEELYSKTDEYVGEFEQKEQDDERESNNKTVEGENNLEDQIGEIDLTGKVHSGYTNEHIANLQEGEDNAYVEKKKLTSYVTVKTDLFEPVLEHQGEKQEQVYSDYSGESEQIIDAKKIEEEDFLDEEEDVDLDDYDYEGENEDVQDSSTAQDISNKHCADSPVSLSDVQPNNLENKEQKNNSENGLKQNIIHSEEKLVFEDLKANSNHDISDEDYSDGDISDDDAQQFEESMQDEGLKSTNIGKTLTMYTDSNVEATSNGGTVSNVEATFDEHTDSNVVSASSEEAGSNGETTSNKDTVSNVEATSNEETESNAEATFKKDTTSNNELPNSRDDEDIDNLYDEIDGMIGTDDGESSTASNRRTPLQCEEDSSQMRKKLQQQLQQSVTKNLTKEFNDIDSSPNFINTHMYTKVFKNNEAKHLGLVTPVGKRPAPIPMVPQGTPVGKRPAPNPMVPQGTPVGKRLSPAHIVPQETPVGKRLAETQMVPQSSMKKTRNDKDNTFYCSLCPIPLQTKKYKVQELLIHLSSGAHFHKDLYNTFPAKIGDPCGFCALEKKPKPFSVPKLKTNYTLHIGKVHGKVIEMLPPDHQVQLVSILKNLNAHWKEVISKLILAPDVEQIIGYSETFTANQYDSYEYDTIDTPSSYDTGIGESFSNTDNTLNTTPSYDTGMDEPFSVNTDPGMYESSSYVDATTNATSSFDTEMDESCPVNTPNTGTGNLESFSVKTPYKIGRKKIQFQCDICLDGKILTSRSKVLDHLSRSHFYKNLSAHYNKIIQPNQPCSMCTPSKSGHIHKVKAAHINHISIFHEKILDFCPEEIVRKISEYDS